MMAPHDMPMDPLLPWTFLVIAAAGGVFLVTRLLRGKAYPRPLGWIHGMLALAGVTLLAVLALSGPADPFLDDGALFLVMAAFGGLTLAGMGLGGHRPPGVLVFLHAVFAIFGLVLLTIALFQPVTTALPR